MASMQLYDNQYKTIIPVILAVLQIGFKFFKKLSGQSFQSI